MKLLSLLALAALILGGTIRALPADVPPEAEHTAALPAEFVTATDTLFADGMSDPRGGVYRQITVGPRFFWEPNGVATRGWVLPATKDSGGKRAVAWNGLTYNVVTDAGPADLNADIAALVKARSAAPKSEPSELRRIYAPDAEFVSNWRPLELTAASILARIGQFDLAKRCYLTAQSETTENLDPKSPLRSDPFLELADNWVGAIYDRAVQEHDRGDERRAADDSEFVTRVSPRIEAQSASRGSRAILHSRLTRDAVPMFNFLDSAAAILTDSKRRLSAPRPALDIDALRSIHAQAADRISLLIRYLDDVSSGQDSIPGSLRFDSDPVVEALVREGDAAVDPLLDTMERDNRLTRVARRERWSNRSNPVSVSYAAYFCLTRILHTSDFGGTGNATVADIRAYWKANRRLPLADRWFRTLSDDSATPARWLEAAKNIVAVVGSNDDAIWGRAPRRSYGSARPPMQGSSLRAQVRPAVSNLLATRVIALARPTRARLNSKLDEESSEFCDSITLALDLAAWDLTRSRSILKMLARRSLGYARKNLAAGLTDSLGFYFGELTVARLHAGDSEAEAEYIKYLQQVLRSNAAAIQPELFWPFCEYPSNPTLAREAKKLFEGSKSRLNPICRPFGSSADIGSDNLVGSSLLCVPAFRRQVVRELDDHRLAGKGLVGEEFQLSWTRGGSSEEESCERLSDPYNRLLGTAFTFRLCDLYAWEVSCVCASVAPASKTPAAPQFEIYWPEPQRDVAIARMRNYLERDGFCFRPADFP